MRRLTAVWPILLALCLALPSGCCRQGYVLHGDWSLGVSHAPPPGCQCAAQGNCSDQCPVHGNCANQCACPGGNACASQDGKRKLCGRGSRSGKGATTAAVPGPTGPTQGHPRFHPVPTRPVFGSGSPPQVVPVAAPDMSDPELADPEDMPLPKPAPSPSSARRPAVRQASASAQSGSNYRR